MQYLKTAFIQHADMLDNFDEYAGPLG